MAANAGGIIITAPAFHGKAEDKGTGTTPEDFIAQVENLRATHGWDNATTARNAVAYLHGQARLWFSSSLLMMDRAAHAAAGQDFRLFKREFVDNYYDVKSAFDLSVDWHGLKQKDRETARVFAARVLAALNDYTTMFARPAMDRPAVEAIYIASENIRTAQIAAGLAGAVPRAFYDALELAAERMFEINTANAISAVTGDIAVKIISEGVRSTKMRELIRRLHKMRTTVRLMLEHMTDLENADGKTAPTVNATPKGLSNAKIHAVQDNVEEEDALSQEEIALITTLRNGRGGARGRGVRGAPRGAPRGNNRGRGAPGGAPVPAQQQQQGKSEDYYSKLCTYCHKYGHLATACWSKQKAEGTYTGNNKKRADHKPAQTDEVGGFFYQAGNAMGYQ